MILRHLSSQKKKKKSIVDSCHQVLRNSQSDLPKQKIKNKKVHLLASLNDNVNIKQNIKMFLRHIIFLGRFPTRKFKINL